MVKYIRASPSGKASDSDSDSTWVRILPPEPDLLRKSEELIVNSEEYLTNLRVET